MRIAVVGDVHGHLQLALCLVARWQIEQRVRFDAVFLCGDVGTFVGESQLDSTTRRHARQNPCELEFLRQWATRPPAPWIDAIFACPEDGGLGLACPVVMVHGNHEGFTHLQTLASPAPEPCAGLADLPVVDSGGHIRWLQSGWRLRLPSGQVVCAIGGIERNQRYAQYHDLAYISEEAVLRLLYGEPIDILVTHQGPSRLQGEHGSSTFDLLLEAPVAPRFWFHGHSTPNREIVTSGTTTIVPLGDLAFQGGSRDDPGHDGLAMLLLDGEVASVRRETPPFWREFRRHLWAETDCGLVAPPLSRMVRPIWRR
jgi:predicted phosphodiesterase